MQRQGMINYAGQNLKGRHFKNTDLYGTTFEGADLTDAHFIHTDLSGVDFEGANMKNAFITKSYGEKNVIIGGRSSKRK
jgi:uncharacterized protein YjbI with pentapeptide repeats